MRCCTRSSSTWRAEPPEPVRNPDLERYLTAIEEHLGRRRGREHVLSPPDFALARGWHTQGIPVEDVIGAIDALVGEGRDPTSLAPCQRWLDGRSGRAPRPAPVADAGELPDDLDRVRAIEAALDALDPARAAHFGETRAAIAAIGSRSQPDPAQVALLEGHLAREAVAALEPGERAAIERRAGRAAARHRGWVTEQALERARQQHLETAALRALGLLPG